MSEPNDEEKKKIMDAAKELGRMILEKNKADKEKEKGGGTVSS